MSDNTRQKTKKNKSRVSTKDRAYFPSIQRNYAKMSKHAKANSQNSKSERLTQNSLFVKMSLCQQPKNTIEDTT